jgi:carboxypeptidase C (cathepsin A)
MMRCFRFLALAALVGLAHFAHAQDASDGNSRDRSDNPTQSGSARPSPSNARGANAAGSGVLGLLPADSVTEHALDIDGRSLGYKATAGTLNLYGQDGERSAAIFYTGYVADRQAPDRPVTFIFNGGPGAASAFLHLGLVGPKRLDFGPTEHDGANAKLVDNPQSWLDFTDLVLIDPIGTGWSRAAKPDGEKAFYGVKQDAQVMAKAIALYLAHTGRASSPKYLLGESYGGLRAIKVANVLQQDQGIVISGIVMLSPLLDGSLLFGADRFALGAALQLPSLAASELELHNAFSKPALQAAEQFALGDFLTTLAGHPPSGATAEAFYGRVAQLTGLPLDIVRRTRGFVRDEFIKHLREDDQAVVSRYDAAFAAPDPFPESDSPRNDDPVLDGFTRAYGGAFVNYARDQLGFKTEMTYALLADDINGKWDWGRGSRTQVSATDDLRQLLAIDPSFRVMIAQGYSDLVVPYGVSKYIVDHLPETLGNRVSLNLYRGGHMIYTKQSSRIEFTADAKAFYLGHPSAAGTSD